MKLDNLADRTETTLSRRLRWHKRVGDEPILGRKLGRFGYHNVWEVQALNGRIYKALIVNAVNSSGLGAGYNHADGKTAFERFPDIEVIVFNNTKPTSPVKDRVVFPYDLDNFLRSEFAPAVRGEGTGRVSFLDPRFFDLDPSSGEQEESDTVFTEPSPAPSLDGFQPIRGRGELTAEAMLALGRERKRQKDGLTTYVGSTNPTHETIGEMTCNSGRTYTRFPDGSWMIS